MGRALVALRQPLAAILHGSECIFIAHQDLGLHAADAGECREFFEQVTEQIPAPPVFENLIYRLERNFLVQLLLVACIPDTPDLRTSDNRQQVELVECSGCFSERKAEALAQEAFGQVHFKNWRQSEGHTPGWKPYGHGH